MKYLISFLGCMLFILSCNDVKITPIKSAFADPFTIKLKPSINLAKKWADTLSLQQGDKTERYYIEYENGINTIYKIGSGISFKGEVINYKGLYYLSEAVDSCYYIYAVKFNNNQVIGFPELREQMYDMDNAVESGLANDLILSKNEDRYYLKTAKKSLHQLYITNLVGMPVWKVNNL